VNVEHYLKALAKVALGLAR